MKSVEFTVTICLGGGDGGDVDVTANVDDAEYKALLYCALEETEPEDVPALKRLCRRICREAIAEAEEWDEDTDYSDCTCMIQLPEEICDAAAEQKNALIEEKIRSLLTGDPEDLEEIETYLDEAGYDGDLEEYAFREAVRCGAGHYVQEHAGDVDLNDEDGASTYLDETDDPEMIEILMDNGAFRPMDYYEDYPFAVETVNWSIIAFTEELQREALARFMGQNGLTEEEILEGLEDEGWEHHTEMEALGVKTEDGQLVFMNMIEEDGSDTRELLENLGWEIRFEGDDWKLNTVGVFFVE